jgi:uncharacterized protein YceH (UPF0502 family)
MTQEQIRILVIGLVDHRIAELEQRVAELERRVAALSKSKEAVPTQ